MAANEARAGGSGSRGATTAGASPCNTPTQVDCPARRWSSGGTRIVQVADTFDAMTTNRPYQRAMRWDAAVARIIELSGIAFDPNVVAAFKAAWYAGELRPELTEPAAAEQKVAAAPPVAARTAGQHCPGSSTTYAGRMEKCHRSGRGARESDV